MGSGNKINLLFGAWLVCVAATVGLLWHEDKFFAVGGTPVATITKTQRDVSYRSEDDVRWKTLASSGQNVFDGDKVATGKRSSALIDFGDGRAANVGEDSGLTFSSIRQKSGLTYILGLSKGSVAIEKVTLASTKAAKNQFPIIIRSGGRDYQIEPGEEKGITRDDRGVVEFKGRRKPRGAAKVSVVSPDVAPLPVPVPAIPLAAIEPVPQEASVVAPVAEPIPAPKHIPKPVVPAKVKKPEVKVAGTEIDLDTSHLKPAYYSFQSLAGSRGEIGNLKWKEPILTDLPADAAWTPAVELYSSAGKKQLALPKGGLSLSLKTDDFGSLKSETQRDGVPCAILKMRGGAKMTIRGKTVWTFSDSAKEVLICSYKDAGNNVPLVVGLASLAGDGNQSRGPIFPAPAGMGLGFQMIVTTASQYNSLLSLMTQSSSFRVAKAQGLAENGVFVAKGGKIVMQLAGSGFNAKSADQVRELTGADLVFKGARSSLYDASHLSVDQLKTMVAQNMAQGKKVYVQKSGNLFAVSRDFLEERREVAVFIKSIASQMFTERVDIVAYK